MCKGNRKRDAKGKEEVFEKSIQYYECSLKACLKDTFDQAFVLPPISGFGNILHTILLKKMSKSF